MAIFRRDPKQDDLRRVSIFARLRRRELDLLARNADLVDVPAGTTLIREGETGHEFFALVDGEVEVSQRGIPIAIEYGGDFFGEIALLYDIPRTATVTTKSPSRVFVFTAQAFRSLVAPKLT